MDTSFLDLIAEINANVEGSAFESQLKNELNKFLTSTITRGPKPFVGNITLTNDGYDMNWVCIDNEMSEVTDKFISVLHDNDIASLEDWVSNNADSHLPEDAGIQDILPVLFDKVPSEITTLQVIDGVEFKFDTKFSF